MGVQHKGYCTSLLLISLLYCLWHVSIHELFDAIGVDTNKTTSAKGDERRGHSRPPTVMRGKQIGPGPGPCRGFYSRIQQDRSGSAIMGMLWHSLYAYKANSTYCGPCGSTSHSPVHQRLLDAMGLSGVLPLLGDDCPDDAEFLDSGNYAEKIEPNSQTVHSDVFADWRRKLTAIVQAHVLGGNDGGSGGEGEPASPCKIVAHVRRGDLDPSIADHVYEKSKYLPNEYYIRLIERYRRPGCRIFVHTEEAYAMNGRGARTATTEGNNDFRALNYTVIVGGREEDAWQNVVDCDVFIASKSDFSFIPAMFSRGMVVFPANHTTTMPDWVIAPANKTCLSTHPTCTNPYAQKMHYTNGDQKEKSLSVINLPF